MIDALHPPPSVLAKIGSIVVHADELISPEGHTFDHFSLLPLLHDPEVVEWLAAMRQMALVPEKRS